MAQAALQKRASLRSACSRWLLAVAVAGAALAVGAVHTVTLCVVTVFLAVAAALVWWRAEPITVRSVATMLLVTGLLLTFYTALQCVPVPIAWLHALASHNADVWARVLAPLHEPGPAWAPISEDPGATRVEVLKGVAYLLAFATALRIARRREGVAFLSATVIVTGMVLAAAALLHPAFGIHRLYGVYEPGPGISDRHIAPLLNPNNLAGYVNISFCLALASALSPEPRVSRAIIGAVVILLGATQVWIASRGGVIAMALGAVIVVAVVLVTRARWPRRDLATLSLVAGAIAVIGAALLVLGGSEDASSELLQANTSKLQMFAHTMRMMPAVPLFGCGRGAFESAFPAFRTGVGYVTFTHPENVIAQWILEWGLPFGVAGLGSVAFALRPNAMLARSTTALGAWAALVAFVVQNMGDLATEIPGVALAAVVCGAIVVGGSTGREPTWRIERWSRHGLSVAICAIASAAIAIVCVIGTIGKDLGADRVALKKAAFDPHVSAAQMHALAKAAMLRHPAEPYLPFITALRASFERDDDAIPWIGATLERATVYGPAHLVLARVVARRSPSQARLEYRLAMQQDAELDKTIMEEAPRMVGTYYDALELVPGGESGIRVLELLGEAIKDRLPSTRVMLDAELVVRAPNAVGPVLRAARGDVEDLESGDLAPWCEGTGNALCVKEALQKSALAEELAPNICEPYSVHARALLLNGAVDAGLSELERAADRVTDRVGCLQTAEKLASQYGDEARAEETLTRIVNAGCGDDSECVNNLKWVAEEQEERGNPRQAMALYERAYERAPEDDVLLERIARLAASSGLHAEAAEDYGRLARRHPGDGRWRAAAEKEKQAALNSTLEP